MQPDEEEEDEEEEELGEEEEGEEKIGVEEGWKPCCSLTSTWVIVKFNSFAYCSA